MKGKKLVKFSLLALLFPMFLVGFCFYKLETSADKLLDEKQHSWLIDELNKTELPDHFYITIEKYYPNHFNNSVWVSVFKQLATNSFNHCRCREVYIPYFYSNHQKEKPWIPFSQDAFVIARELERRGNQKNCYALHFKVSLRDFNKDINTIEDASLFYFDKSLKNLSEKEILSLHLMAKSPTRYDLKRNPDNLEKEINRIISRK